MPPTLTLAAKDLRLLLRDARSGVILLLMPLMFVAVLGMTLGEGFGQRPDDRLRISILNLDKGIPPWPPLQTLPNGMVAGSVMVIVPTPIPAQNWPPPTKVETVVNAAVGGSALMEITTYPGKPWSEIVIDDLASTADIRIELLTSREEATKLVHSGERAAVLIFEPGFSEKMQRSSFLSKTYPPPLNPLYRDGIDVEALGLKIDVDKTQLAAASIIEQVAQVSLLRVVIPWMIGKAFERVGDEVFIDSMGKKIPGYSFLPPSIKKTIGPAVREGITDLFSNFNFTAKTWAGLTKHDEHTVSDKNRSEYSEDRSGVLKRGSLRYQLLVPSYIVMFAFFLVLTVGWLFVAERRQGTLVRLRAAPLTRGQILLGKLVPCLMLSLFQGFFLLLAGYLIFGMHWGPNPLWLIPLVFSTSFAAMGMAMLIAGTARTETQVAVYGTLLVLVLAGISGTFMPRYLMPEAMKHLSYITPHAWALDAYLQLLTNPNPNLEVVAEACGVLTAFGAGFLLVAWWRIRLD
jgi:ABC-type multidrug transport system permease subunit